ncbi:MAG: TIGR04076 family protein [Chloroflexi bacterium]|nr:TIGR04076 family protein [Chloroflexota bacterium]
MTRASDEFVLFDLRVIVESVGEHCTCAVKVGDYFEIQSGKISLPPGQLFCLYALQSALPLLPAKQRPLQSADWMTTDTRVTCPDPACKMIMRIERGTRRVLRLDETSAVKISARKRASK